jgi:hypothetical protein
MSESANKRRVTAQHNDRKAAKSERRQQRQHEHPESVDQAELMSRFHHLNELRSAGTITEDDFARQRHDIFVSLGLEDP